MQIKQLVVAVGVAALAACAAPIKEQEQTGFISDYSRLVQGDDQRYSYVSDELKLYRSFLIDPVTMLHEPDPEKPKFTDEELDELKQYFIDRLTEELTEGEDGYEIVTEPGPGVARIRPAITALDDTTGILNVTIYTRITGAGLGGAAIELELVDSQTGEQLAAYIRWGSGSRVLRAGFTKAGDAKILIKRWVKNLRKDLDALNAGEA